MLLLNHDPAGGLGTKECENVPVKFKAKVRSTNSSRFRQDPPGLCRRC